MRIPPARPGAPVPAVNPVSSQISCIKAGIPEEPPCWTRPEKEASKDQPVALLCDQASSLKSVIRAAYNPQEPQKLEGPTEDARQRQECAYAARIRNKAIPALWKPVFKDGKLCSVAENPYWRPSSELGEKPGNSTTGRASLVEKLTRKRQPGSTAVFDPYQRTFQGVKDCPYYQQIIAAGVFHMPEGPRHCEPTLVHQLPASTDPNWRIPLSKSPFPQRPSTSIGIGVRGNGEVASTPQKTPSDITNLGLVARATSTNYTFKQHYNRTRSNGEEAPGYLKAGAFNRSPSKLHDYYENRRRKPPVQDLRMFGPPIDCLGYKGIHWGPCNF